MYIYIFICMWFQKNIKTKKYVLLEKNLIKLYNYIFNFKILGSDSEPKFW